MRRMPREDGRPYAARQVVIVGAGGAPRQPVTILACTAHYRFANRRAQHRDLIRLDARTVLQRDGDFDTFVADATELEDELRGDRDDVPVLWATDTSANPHAATVLEGLHTRTRMVASFLINASTGDPFGAAAGPLPVGTASGALVVGAQTLVGHFDARVAKGGRVKESKRERAKRQGLSPEGIEMQEGRVIVALRGVADAPPRPGALGLHELQSAVSTAEALSTRARESDGEDLVLSVPELVVAAVMLGLYASEMYPPRDYDFGTGAGWDKPLKSRVGGVA